MPSVSADNQAVTSLVAKSKLNYERFQQALRGQVAELLTGLGNGTQSLMSAERLLQLSTSHVAESIRIDLMEDIGDVSNLAYNAANRKSSAEITERELAVSEAMGSAFVNDLMHSISSQLSKDVQAAQNFLLTQLQQGRFVATTAELVEDLRFGRIDKAGRFLTGLDYVGRELNWSYRHVYNSNLAMLLLTRDIDKAAIDGGSKDGTVINLEQFSEISPTYFHHNSKSLLRPLD